jgi:hypothetical protein
MKFDYYINYYSGRSNTYKLYQTTVTVGAPRMLAMSTSPPSAGASSCASSSAMTAAGVVLSCASAATTSSAAAAAGSVALLTSRGLALHLRQEHFNSGGWATTPSGFPHRVPLAFVALISGLRGRHLLQARKVHRQQVDSRHEYSTTLLKMAHL